MMVNLTLSTLTSSVQHGQSVQTAGLEAQIQRYKKQLSDCIHCESSKTAQGQADIEALSAKITAAKARVDAIEVAKSNVAKTGSADTSSESIRHQERIGGPRNAASTPSQPAAFRFATRGGMLHVLA